MFLVKSLDSDLEMVIMSREEHLAYTAFVELGYRGWSRKEAADFIKGLRPELDEEFFEFLISV